MWCVLLGTDSKRPVYRTASASTTFAFSILTDSCYSRYNTRRDSRKKGAPKHSSLHVCSIPHTLPVHDRPTNGMCRWRKAHTPCSGCWVAAKPTPLSSPQRRRRRRDDVTKPTHLGQQVGSVPQERGVHVAPRLATLDDLAESVQVQLSLEAAELVV